MSNRLADLRVMLSYARADAEAFASELADGLEAANFDVLLDLHDIEAATDWQARLREMIRSVDTLVVIITPGWIGSDLCNWELEEALRQNKRIIPIIHIEPDDAPPPQELSKLNYIFFDDRQSFGTALKQLAPALRVNLAWIRNHTHYSESARLWEARNRDPAMFLRGAELKRAQEWRDQREAEFPEISVSLSEFLNLSAEHETQQNAVKKRSTSWIVAVFLIVPTALAITNGYTLWMNFVRLEGMADTDLRAFLELLAWLIFMDNLALAIIICGVLFSFGGLWLSKNLSTPVLAGITAAILISASAGYFVIRHVAIDVVVAANALDEAAAENAFELDPCSPTVRRAFDRYRAAADSPERVENVQICAPHARSVPIVNSWTERVGPTQYIPIFVLLVLPLLGLIIWRLIRSLTRRNRPPSP
ncbi:MAG: toll/interleukin-1 receptor domain-containing protein [Pseudomonadota bacterium]